MLEIGRIKYLKGVGLEGCRIGCVGLEGCVGLKGCKIGRV